LNQCAALGCGDDWGGTSGAAPLAAGVIALWLEAVPSLGVNFVIVLSFFLKKPVHFH